MNASDRLNTCKSRGSVDVAIHLTATGARVSNTYGTCPRPGDKRKKFRLIPHNAALRHLSAAKGEIRPGMDMRRIS